MKYDHESFSLEIHKIYGNEIKLKSEFINLVLPITVEDKYGVLEISHARLLLNFRPTIKAAKNKTEYFMNMLKEKYPYIHLLILPISNYSGMNKKMLFMTKYGAVSMLPGSLISGHTPNIRSAVNRNEYFENQLREIYGNRYKFEISSTSRHIGVVTIICKKHGRLDVDSDSIFLGSGCPLCKSGYDRSNLFYIVKLTNSNESFYKLGISHINRNGEISRFKSYKELSYKIDVIKTIHFKDHTELRLFELKLKQIIRSNLYRPLKWEANSSTETFGEELLDKVLQECLKYDIVSTSMETLSSLNDGQELTTLAEDN